MILIAKQFALSSSGKIDKLEYLIGGEMLASDQSRIIEQATFKEKLQKNKKETS